MTEKCQYESCKVSEDGVCAFHNVEVERRESMRLLVDKVPAILTKLNWVLGVLSIISILILGSYTFTLISKNELRTDIAQTRSYSDDADALLRIRLASLTDAVGTVVSTISDQRAMLSAQQEQQNAALREFSRLNDSLEKMLERQREHESYVEKQFVDWAEEASEKFSHEFPPTAESHN